MGESGPSQAGGEKVEESPARVVKGGISVEMRVESLTGENKIHDLMDGEDISIAFQAVDTATGVPMSGLRPAVWIDTKASSGTSKTDGGMAMTCKEKISQFLQGSLAYQPEIDLTSYFILVMNDRPSITVLNPQLGMYVSKTVTTIPLKAPGKDWVLTRDTKKLFVTLPKVNQVAVTDTANWKVMQNLAIAENPVRIAMQPDEKYLWVGNDGPAGPLLFSGVTVIDPSGLQVVAKIETGRGHHDIDFSDDSAFAFVTNQDEGTVSVIDVPGLRKVKDVRTGEMPVSAAFSSRAKALYVVHEKDGKVVAVDGKRQEITATLDLQPGIRTIRFSPDGRWGFVLNHKENLVHVLDVSVNRVLHTVQVEPGPDQVGFSATYAYVRSLGSSQVNALQLSLIEKMEKLPVVKIPIGQDAPGHANQIGLTRVITPTPEFDVVLIANPADRNVYYYMEGMLAPMGTFQNYPGEPQGILVVDRSLKETKPGFYSSVLRLPHSGVFDVAFLMESPRLYHCFEISVKPNPAIPRKVHVPLTIEFLTQERNIRVGTPFSLKMRVKDTLSGKAVKDLQDLTALLVLMPGTSQSRIPVEPSQDGVYQVELLAAEPGYYKVFFESPSRDALMHKMPHLNLNATK